MVEIIKEAREFVTETRNDKELRNQPYGHALSMMATILTDKAHMGKGEADQKAFLRQRALELIKEFGPNIITVMRDSYKLSLSEEDLQELNL